MTKTIEEKLDLLRAAVNSWPEDCGFNDIEELETIIELVDHVTETGAEIKKWAQNRLEEKK